jgi:hypothetical protein
LQRPWTGTVPYREGSDEHPRPYLWLTLRGPRSGAGIPIIGLVDSGADKTVLPLDYAQLLGYKPEELTSVQVGQVEGSADAWDAQVPCEAHVNGIEAVKFEIKPLFVTTLDALWGRADFMATYVVSISEERRELGLHLPKLD